MVRFNFFNERVFVGQNFHAQEMRNKSFFPIILDRQRQAEKRVEDPKEKDRKRKQMQTASSGTPKAAALTYAASSQSSTSKVN